MAKGIKFLCSSLGVFFISSVAHSAQGPSMSPCNRPDVSTLSRPIYPDRTSSSIFQYKYQFYKGGSDSSPVIVFMPGGPGEASISNTPEYVYELPSGLNIIYTDQRGSGCNDLTPSSFPEDAYTTRYYAEDVVAIIRSLHLKNYILYGHSFGTAQATIVASLLEKYKAQGEELELPKKIILEGTIGRAFRKSEGFQMADIEWSQVLNRLPQNVRDQLQGNPLPFSELQDPAGNWGFFIFEQLYIGRLPESSSAPDLEHWLLSLSSQASKQREFLQKTVAAFTFPDFGITFRLLGCREIFENYPKQFFLNQGGLMAKGNSCEGMTLSNPFDSKDWPISAPIYYFQGTHDFATPQWQANYHYSVQNHSVQRTLITIGEASHEPLQASLYAAGCRQEVWNALLGTGDNLQKALGQCKWPWPISISTQ